MRSLLTSLNVIRSKLTRLRRGSSLSKSAGSEEAEGACPSAGANGLLPVCSQLTNLTCLLSLRAFCTGCLPFFGAGPPRLERCVPVPLSRKWGSGKKATRLRRTFSHTF